MGTEKVETGPLLAGGYGDKLNYDVCKTATVYDQMAFLTVKDDTLNNKKNKELVRDNLIQSYTEAFKPQQTKKKKKTVTCYILTRIQLIFISHRAKLVGNNL